jgi:hypothetical protein
MVPPNTKQQLFPLFLFFFFLKKKKKKEKNVVGKHKNK